ncbi:MAG TPA: TRZ/ATZ family hydrolase [Thiobacillaceae bacterium]|nr:TRZ/ATZ family hydrolase [Thiobacillaceae bacterium]
MHTPADLLLLPQWVIPVETRGALTDHAVVVQDGMILDLLPAERALARYTAAQTVELPGQAVIPGLVNLHGRAAMSLLRGFADDLPAARWLNDRVAPAEAGLVSESFVRDGTLLAIAEMLAGGITTSNEAYLFPQTAGETFLHAGMRAALGLWISETASVYAADADDCLAKGLDTRDALKDEPLLSFAFALQDADTASDATLARVNTLAEQLGLAIHAPIHASTDRVDDSLKRYGLRPLERLAKLGLLGPAFVGVHAVHLNEAEIGALASHACHIAHCPGSDLKLARGVAPIAELLRAGVNIGLGTDTAASNNRLDLFAEMRLAALLAKGASGDATTLPAAAALEAATLGAARALNLHDRIGSIMPGKRADLVAVDLRSLATLPMFDPASHLVYVAGREHVTHVWVDGKPKLSDRRLVDLDTDDLAARATYWRTKLIARDGAR